MAPTVRTACPAWKRAIWSTASAPSVWAASSRYSPPTRKARLPLRPMQLGDGGGVGDDGQAGAARQLLGERQCRRPGVDEQRVARAEQCGRPARHGPLLARMLGQTGVEGSFAPRFGQAGTAMVFADQAAIGQCREIATQGFGRGGQLGRQELHTHPFPLAQQVDDAVASLLRSQPAPPTIDLMVKLAYCSVTPPARTGNHWPKVAKLLARRHSMSR